MRFVRAAARVVGAVLAMALCVLAPAACAGKAQPQGRNADGTITITLAGWTLATRPEFRALADAYHAQHPDVTVQVKENSSSPTSPPAAPPTCSPSRTCACSTPTRIRGRSPT